MQRYLKKINGSMGFTLIELLVSMLVGILVLAASYKIFSMQSMAFSDQDQIVEMEQNARAAMDMMIREIRMAGYNPTGMSAAGTKPQISAATANSISFIADLNGNGDTTANATNPNENITYNVYTDGGGIQCLGRTSNGALQPVVDRIQSLTFTYILSDGTQVANPTAAQITTIANIIVSITAQSARARQGTASPMTYTLTSRVVPRNLSVS